MENGQKEEAKMLLRRNSVQNLFNGYDFDVEQLRHQIMLDKRKREAAAAAANNMVTTTSTTNVTSADLEVIKKNVTNSRQ